MQWQAMVIVWEVFIIIIIIIVVVQLLSCFQLFECHGLYHARLPCPSLSHRVCSCPLGQWCHPTISSSVAPFSSCLQSFPASGSFPMSWLFTSGGQSIGASALASVLLMTNQGWFPLAWTGLISLQSKGLSRVSVFWHSAFFMVQFSHAYMTTGKTIALTRWTFVGKVMSLLFNITSRFVIAFLPGSKHLLILCLKSLSAVVLKPRK